MSSVTAAVTFMNAFPYGHGHGQGRKMMKMCVDIWQIFYNEMK